MKMDGLSSFSPPSVLPDISPSRGKIGWPQRFRQSPTLPLKPRRLKLLIFPLEAEMSGGTEGGFKMRGPSADERQHAQQVWSVSK